MRLALLLLIIFILNGCSQKCEPVPCTKQKCLYPTLPTYKLPVSNKIPTPKQLGDGTCVVGVSDLLELVDNNNRLRRICTNYAVVNKRVNKEYE